MRLEVVKKHEHIGEEVSLDSGAWLFYLVVLSSGPTWWSYIVVLPGGPI